jgi:streptogramin lyase
MNRPGLLLALPLLALIATTSRAESVYVTEANGNIYSYDPSQNFSTPTLFYNGSGASLAGITFDGSGNAYVANSVSQTIEKITPMGQATTYATIGGGSYPLGVTFDSSGNLYVADGGNGFVDKVDPSGNVTLFANLNNAPVSNNGPYAIAFDRSGNLYVSVGNGVLEYDSSGNYVRDLTDNGAITGANGIVFDSSGSLDIANATDNNIYEYSSTGQYSIFASTGLALIQSLAIDSSGNLFVNSQNNGPGLALAEYSTTGPSRGSLIASGSTLYGTEFLAVLEPAAVPEPSSLILVVTGLAGGLAFAARRARGLTAR